MGISGHFQAAGAFSHSLQPLSPAYVWQLQVGLVLWGIERSWALLQSR